MEDCEAAKSDCSSEEWMDLTKSEYSQVIFSKLDWNAASGEVSCMFALTESVNKEESDYIGLFKVGYDNISQCLAKKKLKDLNVEDDSKAIRCCFKPEELPELSGFYQFVYITQDEEVCGASMPFEVNVIQDEKTPADVVVTAEKVESDFLMVRYGLEEKNLKLKAMVDSYHEENLELADEIKKLELQLSNLSKDSQTQDSIIKKTLEMNNHLKLTIDDMLNEKDLLKDENEIISSALRSAKQENEILKFKLIKLEDANEKICKLTETAEMELVIMERDLKEKLISVGEQKDDTIEKLKDKIEDLKLEMSKLREQKNAVISELHNQVKIKDEHFSKLQTDFEVKKAEGIEISIAHNNLKSVVEEMKKDFSELEARYKMLLENNSKEKAVVDKDPANLIISKNEDKFKDYWGSEFCRATSELAEANSLIQALKESKKLAMKEMSDLTDDLKKANKELSATKCENFALKHTLDEYGLSSKYAHFRSRRECDQESSQLADANSVIQALNDSKQLAMKEMLELADKLKKTNKELSETKCENLALRVTLEEVRKSCKPALNSVQEKESADKETQAQKDIILQAVFLSEMKILDPTIELHNLGDKVLEHIRASKRLEQELDEKNVSLRIQTMKLHKDQLKSRSIIDKLEKEKELYKKQLSSAEEELADKTARIMAAADVYMDLYRQKEKLARKLKKVLDPERRSKKSAAPDVKEASKPDCLPLNIQPSPTNSEMATNQGASTSTNSDSDTGELVRFQKILYPELKMDENYTSLLEIQKSSLLKAEEELSDVESTYSGATEAESCTGVDSSDNKACSGASCAHDQNPSPTSLQDVSLIPCTFCGEEFMITPYSNIAMIDHMDKVHNHSMCPVCGQLFDKKIPSKYFEFHINDHFKWDK